MAPIDALNWSQPIGEDWKVSNVNTIQVPKGKRFGMCLVYSSMLKNFKGSLKIKGKV
jgi:hypothetical protein